MRVDGSCRHSGNSQAQVIARAEQTTVCSAFFTGSIMQTTNDVFLNHINFLNHLNSVCSRCGLVATAHAEFH